METWIDRNGESFTEGDMVSVKTVTHNGSFLELYGELIERSGQVVKLKDDYDDIIEAEIRPDHPEDWKVE